MLLLSLASPDESSLVSSIIMNVLYLQLIWVWFLFQKYEVEFLLNQQWNDPRLQYGNKSHYDFLNALHHHDSIWTPDTYFIMHGDFKDPIIPMHFALRIFRNGTITYAMRCVLYIAISFPRSIADLNTNENPHYNIFRGRRGETAAHFNVARNANDIKVHIH